MHGSSASVGDEIRRRRTELGWSQTELADRLGVQRSTVFRVESGQNSPRVKTLCGYATVLGCTVQDLVSGVADGPPNP